MWWWVSVAVPAAAHRRPVGIEDVLSFRHVLQITGQLHRGRTRPTDAVANTRTSPDGETREPFLQTSISAGFLFQLLCWFGETVFCKKIVNFFTNVNTGRMKVFTESQLRAVPVWSAWRRPGGQTLRLQTLWGNGPPQDWVPHHSSNHPLTNRTTGGRNGQRWLELLKRINESVWFPGSPLIFGVTQTQVLCDQLGVGMNCAVVVFGAPGTSVGAEEGVMIDTGPPQVFTGFGTRQNHRHFTVLSLTLKEEEQEHKQNRSLVKFYYFVPLHSMK